MFKLMYNGKLNNYKFKHILTLYFIEIHFTYLYKHKGWLIQERVNLYWAYYDSGYLDEWGYKSNADILSACKPRLTTRHQINLEFISNLFRVVLTFKF